MMKIRNKFRYAAKGLKILLKDSSVLLQTGIAVIAVAASFLFHFEDYEKLAVFILCVIVIGTECVNYVVEYMAEQMDPAKDPAIGKIKDMMAGAVLCVSIGALIAGVWMLLRHI